MFRRPPQLAIVLLCLALFACTGLRCSQFGSRAEPSASTETTKALPPKPRPDLRVLVLTDPRGYLEPCGCQQRPLGGVDKLAQLVAKARADGVPTLLVAAGDLTFGTELRPEDVASAATQEAWRAESLVEAWNQIGLAAAAPGKLDLGQPEALLKPLIAKSQFPWLVDNLTPQGTLGTAPGRVFEVGGVKVGVLGVVAPDPSLRLPEGTQLSTDLSQVVTRAAAGLKSQGAQVVIALLSGDRRAARSLAGHGVDVVVMGGVDLEHPLPPALHERTLLLHAGRQGQRLVQLDLALKAEGEPHDESLWTVREARKDQAQKVTELREKIRAWEKAKDVSASDLDAQRARLLELERMLSEPRVPHYQGRWLSAEVSELAPEVPGDKTIAALVDAYDKRVNEHNRKSLTHLVPAPAKEGEAHFAGSESCKGCHEPAYAWWRNTGHGRAYATLERVHKEFNLSCVGCHVTGYNLPGGSTVTHVENLKDVGCENCHGPGSLHNAEPQKPNLVAADTPARVCVGCHTHEHSDRFVYDAFKTLLVAPGHGLPVAKAP